MVTIYENLIESMVVWSECLLVVNYQQCLVGRLSFERSLFKFRNFVTLSFTNISQLFLSNERAKNELST